MSKSSLYKEEAIPLITFSKDSYEVNSDAIQFINSIPAPLGIIGVAGMYRTGKSYLLNKMILDRAEGFGVGSTINPCTKGLWIWGSPIKGQGANGEPINILVIDSEGIGALDEDTAHDTRVFSLTILLSSIFIYNSQGSIDENAIQNLSLVINLTKNIHLNSSMDNEEVDPDEYGKFFPSFIWIIRDFTLKLVDLNGNQINSKQYLENSLAQQDGFSDDTEQKNRIRRLLTTFFPDRDCITMVRPLTNEANLQILNQMPLEKLRPEFYQQVLNLRNRVLNKMRPKTMNGKNLNGTMLSSLLVSYAKSINEGSVPNIENAWTYLLREQAEKAVDETIDLYYKEVTENIIRKMPMSQQNLKTQHGSIKENVLSFFKEKDLGEAAEIGLKDIEKRMKEKISELKAMNIKDSAKECQNFVKKEWLPLEKRLKMNEIKTFAEFDRELNAFHQKLLEKGPDLDNKEVYYLSFIEEKLSEGANFYIKNLNNEIEIQKSTSLQFQNQYDKDVKQVQENLQKEKKQLSQKVEALEKEKDDFEQRIQAIRNENSDLQKSKGKLESEISNQYLVEQEKFKAKIAELTQKLSESENSLKEKSRSYILIQGEIEQEKSVMTLKSQQMEFNLEEGKKKIRLLEENLQNINGKVSEDFREMSFRYESTIKTLQTNVTELTDKVHEYEHQSSIREHIQTNLKENQEKSEVNFKSSIQEANKTIDQLMQQIKEMGIAESERIKKLKIDFEADITVYKQKISDQEIIIKERSDKINEFRSTIEKDKSIIEQKLEFAESELSDVKQQLTDLKKAHEAAIKAFEMMQSENKSLITQKDILEMKENHLNDKKQLENELLAQKKQFLNQIDLLNEKINELELKGNIADIDSKKQIDTLKESLEQKESARLQLEIDLRNMETLKLKTCQEIEEGYKKKLEDLENEIHELKKAHLLEIRLLQSQFEENLKNLKELYESQRLGLEKRLFEEHESAERKYSSMVEEYELKITEMQTSYEDEIANLQEDLRDNEIQYQSMVQQYDHEINMLQKTNENLEKLLQEAKENLSKLQENNKTDLEKQIQQFITERSQLIEKIENLTRDLNNKDNDLINLTQKYEDLLKNAGIKDEMIEKVKGELGNEKNENANKLEDLKKKNQGISSEYLEKKIEYEKNAALSHQQIEFLNNRVGDLQRVLDENMKLANEKIERLKEELIQEHNLRMSQAAEEKLNLEQRHEKLKRSAKDNESSNQKRLADLEREKAILTEKSQQYQNRINDLENKLELEVHNYNLQINQFKDNQEQDKRPLLSDLEKYRALCLQFESEKNEITALYEKDRVLWEARFNFLEQQREQAKNDLNEAMKKFEATLENLQKARNNEKNQNENTLTDLLLGVEKKYQSQIHETNGKYQVQIEELEEKIRRLEREVKASNDRITLDTHGKLGNQILNERKLAEMLENEKRLISDMNEVKMERELKIREYQQNFDKERENLKKKMNDLEDKIRELENNKSNLLFEHEKERAKWNIERDHLFNEKGDLQDAINKLERKKELLLRENEKFKNDAKNFRKVNNTIVIEKVQKSLNASSQNLGDALRKSASRAELSGGRVISSSVIRTSTYRESANPVEEEEENKEKK